MLEVMVRRRAEGRTLSKAARVARHATGVTLAMEMSAHPMCSGMASSELVMVALIMPGGRIGISKGLTEATIEISEVTISIDDHPIHMFAEIICLVTALILLV
jgi:hypothetical protein